MLIYLSIVDKQQPGGEDSKGNPILKNYAYVVDIPVLSVDTHYNVMALAMTEDKLSKKFRPHVGKLMSRDEVNAIGAQCVEVTVKERGAEVESE